MRRLAFAALAVLPLVGCGKSGNTYPPETVSAFLDSCMKQGPRQACECTLAELQRRFTFEQFTALEDRTRAEKKPPQEFLDAANACR